MQTEKRGRWWFYTHPRKKHTNLPRPFAGVLRARISPASVSWVQIWRTEALAGVAIVVAGIAGWSIAATDDADADAIPLAALGDRL